jgi:copper chaperone CopZ
MRCANCLRTIRNATRELPGVDEVRGDLAAKVVTVSYRDGTATPGSIREAIALSGFRVGRPLASAERPRETLKGE